MQISPTFGGSCWLVILCVIATCTVQYVSGTYYCPRPRAPQYGRVHYSGLGEGAKATYSCNHGYKLYGSGVLVCRNDGTWSKTVPTCRG